MSKSKRFEGTPNAPYPHATIAFYGADDRFATKAVAAVYSKPNQPPIAMQRWFFKGIDIREDAEVTQEIVAWVKAHGATHSTVAEEILGCPHEEGSDFPQGQFCPLCRFWSAVA